MSEQEKNDSGKTTTTSTEPEQDSKNWTEFGVIQRRIGTTRERSDQELTRKVCTEGNQEQEDYREKSKKGMEVES